MEEYELLSPTEDISRNTEKNEKYTFSINSVLIFSILLSIILIIFILCILGLGIFNTITIQTQLISSLQLLNGNNSGLSIERFQNIIEIFNTGIHNVTPGPGIDINETGINIYNPVVSLSEPLNCSGNFSAICQNVSQSFNNTFNFNCTECSFNGTFTISSNTTIIQNFTFQNFTNITNNTSEQYPYDNCCTANFSITSGIDVVNINNTIEIINTGVLNISVDYGLINSGNQSFPIISTDFEAGDGISITGNNPMVFNNTGVLEISAGQNIIVTSSNNDGTGIVTVSVSNALNQNISSGVGINITQANNTYTVINDGVVQTLSGLGISTIGSSGNGQGIVNITNTGVIQIFPGNGVNITGTVQNPIINLDTFSLNALYGIFVNNSGNIFDIGNTGVLQIKTGSALTVTPSIGTGDVTLTSSCINVATGSGLNLTKTGSNITISSNYIAGYGVNISGSNPKTVSLSIAGDGSSIFLSGTNPVTISAIISNNYTGGNGVNAVYDNIVSPPSAYFTMGLPDPMCVNLGSDWTSTTGGGQNCPIGFTVTSAYWSKCFDGGSYSVQSSVSQYGQYVIPNNGTYYVSFTITSSTAFLVDLAIRNATLNSVCTACTGFNSCRWNRILSSGNYIPLLSGYVTSQASSIFYFTAGQVLGLLQDGTGFPSGGTSYTSYPDTNTPYWAATWTINPIQNSELY